MGKYISILFLLILTTAIAQENDVWFQPNHGQWDSRIVYRVPLTHGDFFVEKNKFTFALNDIKETYQRLHLSPKSDEVLDEVKNHTIQAHFINSSWDGEVEEEMKSDFYNNYFIGNDESKWKSKIHSYQKLRLIDFYPGINLLLETTSEAIKYSFEVQQGVDPSIILIKYVGMSDLEVKTDELIVDSRFGPIRETGLKSWGASDLSEVEVKYSINNGVISYEFPNGYDETQDLIIDPYLTFSTFTGATSDNWGFTATPDSDGNLYAGGIVFGAGYPITVGAFDDSFGGGDGFRKIDMGISKFSADGTELVYSTFLGGNGNETPNSIIVNNQDELYILGITTSSNFPVSSNAYQSEYKGGTLTDQIGIRFQGTDIILSKLSSDGTQLLAGTYLGGEQNDGLNLSSLNYNYGDVFRGEIILDNNGDVVIASSTHSSDFPIVNGASGTLGGNQDGVVAKLSSDFSNLIWSTFLGGSDDDAGFSVQVNSSNNLLVTGGTKSTDLPFIGGHQSSFQGGASDGYIMELDGTTSNVLRGTYIGTSDYDQSFFVQLDNNDRVYVFGQTSGNFPVTAGVYSNPNSGQFIQQYSSDLSTLNWSTIVGGGNGTVEISPTAFLVSNCNEIYYTGWGGEVNQNNSQATGSTSNGFPVTADAYQSSTNGNNFYIGVLEEDALALKYGTFMGGTNSSFNHVDGGTSRFDKQGRIYHAVCGACGGNSNGFTTTPGAYSEVNNSNNCNLAAWKFDLGAVFSAISVPDALVCLPESVHFSNDSQNGGVYVWDFGDGNTSTEFEPSHLYSDTGTYIVSLVVHDAELCFDSDTSYLVVEIGKFDGGEVDPYGVVCPGEPYQLEASGGVAYSWSPAEFLDDPTSATPIALIEESTEFTVIVLDSCGSDTLKVFLELLDPVIDVINDTVICKGTPINLWAEGGVDYTWTSTEESSIIGVSDTDVILINPSNDAEYSVEIITSDGCVLNETVLVEVVQDIPQSGIADTVAMCQGESVQLVANPANNIVWSPDIEIFPNQGSVVQISATEDRWYYIDMTNICGTIRDSVFIEVVTVEAIVSSDTIVCPGEQAVVWASGGVSYEWNPKEFLSHPHDSLSYALPEEPTVFSVIVTDENGCSTIESVLVDHYPHPKVWVSSDYIGFVGDEVPLTATGSGFGSYIWSPSEFLSCVNCPSTIAKPPTSMTYTVTYIDENGCKAMNQVHINFDAIIYVPNTFTPDGNGYNEMFLVEGGNISEFQIIIFNRWGEVVFESNDIHIGWDGTYNGRPSPDGTYVWKIVYSGFDEIKSELVGHVNLLR